MSARSSSSVQTTARPCVLALLFLACAGSASSAVVPSGLATSGLVASGLVASGQYPQQELTVCVTDGRGHAVAGVTVVLVGTLHGSVTDPAGCVRFPSVAPGTYVLQAVIDGYGPAEVAIVVHPDTPGYVEVVVRRQGLEQRRFETPEVGLLAMFDEVRVSDGYVSSGSQRRTGSHAEGTRRLVIPFSERLHDFSDGRPFAAPFGGSSGRVDPYTVRPFVEVAATSNTESLRLEAGAGSSTDRRGYAARIVGAGGAPYSDGESTTVDSRYRTNGLRLSAFRATHRLRAEFVGGALYDTRGNRPATGLDVDGAIAATGRFAVDVLDGVGGSSYRFELGGTVSNDAWEATTIPGAPSYSMVGSHDRYEVDGTARIEYPFSDQLRASAAVGVRVVRQTQELRVEDGLEIGMTAYPEIRDGAFDVQADLAYTTPALGISGSVGLTAVTSSRHLAHGGTVRSSHTLPTAKIAVRLTRPSVQVIYELHHAEWLPSYEVRSQVAGYFWSGQQLVQAVPSATITGGRSTLQRVGFELPRGSVALHASLSVEWLHDVVSIHSSADEFALSLATEDAGLTSTLSGGISWEPLGGVRGGLVGHLLRAHNKTQDEPLASLPSSVVGGFVEIAPFGEYPFVRWTTENRLRRTRVAVQPEEVETPGSLETNVVVGLKIRNVALSLGVLNMGDRVVRDHTSTRSLVGTFVQSAPGAAANYPGRRFHAALRLQLPG